MKSSPTSLLSQLGGDECVLLMYLADELPPGDRTTVECRLAAEPALREMLEQMRSLHDDVSGVIADADRHCPPLANTPVLVRHVGRAMRQWQTDRMAPKPAPVVDPKSLRYAWWTYPLTAAAALLIAFLVWWGQNPNAGNLAGDFRRPVPVAVDPEAEELVAQIADSFGSANVLEDELASLDEVADEMDQLLDPDTDRSGYLDSLGEESF